MKRFLLALMLCLPAAGAWAACPGGSLVSVFFKDANGTNQPVCFLGTSTGYISATALVDGTTGVDIGQQLVSNTAGVTPGQPWAGKGDQTLGHVQAVAPTGLINDTRDGFSIAANGGGIRTDRTSIAGNLITVDPCDVGPTSSTPISITTNTQIISGAAGKRTFICALNLVVGAADNVALVEGTGATCGTGTVGMAGGATAATGWNFTANGGLTLGNGRGKVIGPPPGAANADNICLLVSAAAQVSGAVVWTQQ